MMFWLLVSDMFLCRYYNYNLSKPRGRNEWCVQSKCTVKIIVLKDDRLTKSTRRILVRNLGSGKQNTCDFLVFEYIPSTFSSVS